jgi:GT2 family glycosyltransferase
MRLPKVAIIILNWNGRDDTIRCLDSLAKTDYEPLDILLVDNGSIDDSVAVLRERYPQITMIENPVNLGFCEGNNIGIRRAMATDADYIMLLNNDATLAPDAVRRLVAAGEADPHVGILGPKTYSMEHPGVIYSTGIAWYPAMGVAEAIGMGEPDRGQFDQSCDRPAVGGHAFFIKRAVVESIGGLDPDYFAYFEEMDFCMRARAAGFASRYVADAVVWHKGHGSNAGRLRAYLLQRNQLMFVRKNSNLFQRLAFFTYFLSYRMPKLILVYLIARRFGDLGIFLKAVTWHVGIFRRDNPVVAQSLRNNARR